MMFTLSTIQTSSIAIASFIFLGICSGLISANVRRLAGEKGWDAWFLKVWNSTPEWGRKMLAGWAPLRQLWWLWFVFGLSGGLGAALFILSPHITLVEPAITPSVDASAKLQAAARETRDDGAKEASQLKSQLDAKTRELESALAQLAALSKPVKTAANVVSDSGPIRWEHEISFYGSTEGIAYTMLRGINTSSSPIQMDGASFTSGLTGDSHPLLVSIPFGRLDGEKISVDRTNPVPPGAKIQLIAEWKPAISLMDFVKQWGNIHLLIEYGDIKYKRVFDEDYMRSTLVRDIVGADLALGVPRVTKKQ
jgi:hypothetical protein